MKINKALRNLNLQIHAYSLEFWFQNFIFIIIRKFWKLSNEFRKINDLISSEK